MLEPNPTEDSDRRVTERRTGPRLADLPLPELRRIVITSLLFAGVLALFLWMVRAVIIAAILGAIIAAYLHPAHRWARARLGSEPAAALLTLVGVIVPFIAVVVYSYVELLKVADHLVQHEARLAEQIIAGVRRLPGLTGRDVGGAVRDAVGSAAAFAREIPGAVTESAGSFAVGAAIFLFTAFYVLTHRERIGRYLRGHIAPRYAELVGALEENVRGVLYGAIYSTLVTQALKSAVVFILFFLLGVPLAAVLATAAFVIGFFPVVGSWTVYLPVAVWLLVFRGDALAAVVVLAVGLLVNTLLISFYLRPKLAAEKSHVLDFYWMFVGLVTGVYTFGIAGLVLGPILIGVLSAIVDTVAARASWRLIESEYAAAEPEGE